MPVDYNIAGSRQLDRDHDVVCPNPDDPTTCEVCDYAIGERDDVNGLVHTSYVTVDEAIAGGFGGC